MSEKWVRSRAWDDRNIPGWMWPLRAVLRALSSISLAAVLLGGIVVWLAAGALPLPLPDSTGEGVAWRRLWEHPAVEMTESELAQAWPLRVMLGLFVLNMIVATVRRIEFHCLNTGVFVVHGGIVVLSVGFVVTMSTRQEGELLITRAELDPPLWSDTRTASIECSLDGEHHRVALAGLPRMNDWGTGWDLRRLSIPVDTPEPFPGLTVAGYASEARLLREWMPDDAGPPVWRLSVGDGSGAVPRALVAGEPLLRSIRLGDGAAIEHVDGADADAWERALALSGVSSPAVLLISTPEGWKAVPLVEGSRIELENAGARLRLISIEPASVVPAGLAPDGAMLVSPAAVIEVSHADAGRRTIVLLADFPEWSYEVIADDAGGVTARRAVDLPWMDGVRFVDASTTRIVLRGRSALVSGPGGGFRMIEAIADGHTIGLPGGLTLRFDRFEPGARERRTPDRAADEGRSIYEIATRRWSAMGLSVEDVEGTVWIAHSIFDERPASVRMKDSRTLTVRYGPLRRPLPVDSIRLEAFTHEPSRVEGAQANHYAQISVKWPGDAAESPALISLNRPLRWESGGGLLRERWTLSLAGWDRDADPARFVLLAVDRSRGMPLVVTGGIMVAFGAPWALFVKPWLVRRRAAVERGAP